MDLVVFCLLLIEDSNTKTLKAAGSIRNTESLVRLQLIPARQGADFWAEGTCAHDL